MEENIKNEVVDKAFDELVEKAENLDKAIVETAATLPAEAQTKPLTNGTNIALGVGTFLGGLAVGAALDHWAVPAVKKGWEKLKANRAKKKAERKLKKAKKAAEKAQENKPAEPAKEAPATENDGIDPNTIETKID